MPINRKKRKCFFCDKLIIQKTKQVILVHRKCWLLNRDFNLKQFDFLFCNERKKGNRFRILPPSV
jgi:hypothetical protein